MATRAYFVNAVKDNISVNVNNALQTTPLSPRPSLDSGGVQTIAMAVAPFDIKANKDKGIFGLNSINRVTIQFESHEDASQFEVTVTNLTGQNLYFYVFDNTMVGQNEQGSSLGIKIELLEVVLKPVQGVGVA